MDMLIEKRNGKLYIAEGLDKTGKPIVKTRSYADVAAEAPNENILGFLNVLESLTEDNVIKKGIDTKAVFDDEDEDEDDEEDWE